MFCYTVDVTHSKLGKTRASLYVLDTKFRSWSNRGDIVRGMKNLTLSCLDRPSIIYKYECEYTILAHGRSFLVCLLSFFFIYLQDNNVVHLPERRLRPTVKCQVDKLTGAGRIWTCEVNRLIAAGWYKFVIYKLRYSDRQPMRPGIAECQIPWEFIIS